MEQGVLYMYINQAMLKQASLSLSFQKVYLQKKAWIGRNLLLADTSPAKLFLYDSNYKM